MAGKNKFEIRVEFVIIALLVGGCGYGQNSNSTTPEGTWGCTTVWSYENEGTSVPCAAEQQLSCVQNVLSAKGVISIGPAQWTETKEGTCFASEQDLYGTWTSIDTVPKNDAARQFEQDKLGGRSLASTSDGAHQDYRVRVISRSATQLTGIAENGRTVACSRL